MAFYLSPVAYSGNRYRYRCKETADWGGQTHMGNCRIRYWYLRRIVSRFCPAYPKNSLKEFRTKDSSETLPLAPLSRPRRDIMQPGESYHIDLPLKHPINPMRPSITSPSTNCLTPTSPPLSKPMSIKRIPTIQQKPKATIDRVKTPGNPTFPPAKVLRE